MSLKSLVNIGLVAEAAIGGYQQGKQMKQQQTANRAAAALKLQESQLNLAKLGIANKTAGLDYQQQQIKLNKAIQAQNITNRRINTTLTSHAINSYTKDGDINHLKYMFKNSKDIQSALNAVDVRQIDFNSQTDINMVGNSGKHGADLLINAPYIVDRNKFSRRYLIATSPDGKSRTIDLVQWAAQANSYPGQDLQDIINTVKPTAAVAKSQELGRLAMLLANATPGSPAYANYRAQYDLLNAGAAKVKGQNEHFANLDAVAQGNLKVSQEAEQRKAALAEYTKNNPKSTEKIKSLTALNDQILSLPKGDPRLPGMQAVFNSYVAAGTNADTNAKLAGPKAESIKAGTKLAEAKTTDLNMFRSDRLKKLKLDILAGKADAANKTKQLRISEQNALTAEQKAKTSQGILELSQKKFDLVQGKQTKVDALQAKVDANPGDAVSQSALVQAKLDMGIHIPDAVAKGYSQAANIQTWRDKHFDEKSPEYLKKNKEAAAMLAIAKAGNPLNKGQITELANMGSLIHMLSGAAGISESQVGWIDKSIAHVKGLISNDPKGRLAARMLGAAMLQVKHDYLGTAQTAAELPALLEAYSNTGEQTGPLLAGITSLLVQVGAKLEITSKALNPIIVQNILGTTKAELARAISVLHSRTDYYQALSEGADEATALKKAGLSAPQAQGTDTAPPPPVDATKPASNIRY